MKMENMFSNKSGRSVPNQLIIRDGGKRYFQSYDTIIALIDEIGCVILDKEAWKYSKTTIRYRNQFLGESSKEVESKVKSGKYILADLNIDKR